MVKAILSVQVLTLADLPGVSRIHLLAFRDSALSHLGYEAVRRYYEWQLTGPHDVLALGAFLDNQLIAFCFGGVFRGSFGGFVRKNRTYLATRVIFKPWLLADPMFRDRLKAGVRALHILGGARRHSPVNNTFQSTENARKSFGILAIAVDPKSQRTGAGRLLMTEAERIARERDFQKMDLTVHPDNSRAVEFYEHLEWNKVTAPGGPWHGAMVKYLIEES